MLIELLAAAVLAIWIVLIAARGAFWMGTEHDVDGPPPETWPAVTAIIPARDEAAGIGEGLSSLFWQDYDGPLSVILVDDESTDGTAAAAHQAAAEVGAQDRFTIVHGAALPAGWTGKLWAIKQGVARAEQHGARYFLLTDADIAYAPDTLTRLVSDSEARGLVLNSLMAKLRCETEAERALIPAFIYFFQMIYPFPWVNNPRSQVAAAAGGCMLVRSEALRAAGGVESIREALIDDCAMAQRLKAEGPIRLALTERVRSIRGYDTLGEIRRMVARSAYAQLNYSPLMLIGVLLGLIMTFIAPVAFALYGHGFARIFGLAAWLAMAWSFQPTLRLYRLSPMWGLVLPIIALVYAAFTIDSAYQHARGRGGLWKGRTQAHLDKAPFKNASVHPDRRS